MSKRGIIGRVAQLAHANVGAVVDTAEDPHDMTDQLARDYSATIAEAERAIAQLDTDRRVAADDQRADAEAAEQWAAAAAATSQTADELRAAGDAAAADRFDRLARVAIARELMAENDVEASQHAIVTQTESIETLSSGLSQMQTKLSALTRRPQRLTADSGAAQARRRGNESVIRNINVLDPASEVALFQDAVHHEEARLRGGDPQRLPRAAQATEFACPDGDSADETEIEERLQGLKTARAMASALARANNQPFK